MLSGKKEQLAGWGNYPVAESYTIHPRNEADCIAAMKKKNWSRAAWAGAMATRPSMITDM